MSEPQKQPKEHLENMIVAAIHLYREQENKDFLTIYALPEIMERFDVSAPTVGRVIQTLHEAKDLGRGVEQRVWGILRQSLRILS